MKENPIVTCAALVLLCGQIYAVETNAALNVRTLGEKELKRTAEEMGVREEKVQSMMDRVDALWEQFQAERVNSSGKHAAVRRLVRLAGSLRGTIDVSMAPVIEGRIVPEEVFKVSSAFSASDADACSIQRSGFLGLKSDEWPEQIFLCRAVWDLAETDLDLLAELFAGRAGSLPPTAGDLIVYLGVQTALGDNPLFGLPSGDEEGRKMPRESRRFLALSTAPNPVYRLLILDLLPGLCSEAGERVSALAQFAGETDPTIQLSAVKALARIGLPQTTNVLTRFRNQALKDGHLEVVETVDKTIRKLDGSTGVSPQE